MCQWKAKQKRKSVYKDEKTEACDTDSESNDDYLFVIREQEDVNSVKTKHQPRLNVTINGVNAQMLVDTASSVNVLDENTYKKFQVKPKLLNYY